MHQAIVYLQRKGMIKTPLTANLFFLSHPGVQALEDALDHPDRATAGFPPLVSIVQIGHVENSQIQQGTTGSTHTATM